MWTSKRGSCCIIGKIIMMSLPLRRATILGHRINDLGQWCGRPGRDVQLFWNSCKLDYYIVQFRLFIPSLILLYYRVLQAYLIAITDKITCCWRERNNGIDSSWHISGKNLCLILAMLNFAEIHADAHFACPGSTHFLLHDNAIKYFTWLNSGALSSMISMLHE